MYPLVSVIMPVYNAEKYVEVAIESAFNQTYKNIELIVIDDGSTDHSKEKISKMLSRNESDIKTYYYYQNNQGPSAARNFGVEKSSGTYLAFLDADDLYDQDKIRTQVNFLENNAQIDIVYNDLQVVDAKLNHLNILYSEGDFPDKETFLTNLFFRQIVPAPASIMLKRHCFDRVSYNPNLVYAEDYDFLIRLAENFNFGYEPGTYYICRRHSNNLTNNHTKQVESEINIIKSLGEKKIENIVFSSIYDNETQVVMLAKIMLKVGNYNKAEQLLKSFEKIPNAYVSFYLGNISYINKNYLDAISYYEKALHLDNQLSEAFNNMGCCYVLLENINHARECFEKALAMRTNYQDARFNLSSLEKNNIKYKFTQRELRKQLLEYQK
ncbi:glycosyltransferase [Bacillus sp. S/N-304-OC-R1]|uniref:glycosyltransferase n=1 Tax=Bacillus sp. S/N-304-OC-R1 TaxID=2758034 RepID=UPI001C8D509D|nr:glycosyltransferase [Bacillus sp. S/N-304-OC-R1]MBY0123455.1 glycosyltransferase [Bacillus sp. S/N-304-OC-R1]